MKTNPPAKAHSGLTSPGDDLISRRPFEEYARLSLKIYNPRRVKDYRRMLVFMVRALANNRQMKDLLGFFQRSPLHRKIAAALPAVYEQATRQFFYKNSTFEERSALIQSHFRLLFDWLTEAAITRLYLEDGITLWTAEFEERPLALKLSYHAGRKKEGLLALVLTFDKKNIYQANFWFARSPGAAPGLWVGALQGTPGGRDTVRDLTKSLFGYRPKNLIIYGLRLLCRELGISQLRAVSNGGYYANNHFRIDRKLKTLLDDFWEETGGHLGSDPRFFELPADEPRKGAEEVEPRKRSLYRKRFALLDTIDATFTENLRPFLRARANSGPEAQK